MDVRHAYGVPWYNMSLCISLRDAREIKALLFSLATYGASPVLRILSADQAYCRYEVYYVRIKIDFPERP